MKPVKMAMNAIREAKTADEALALTTKFLVSADAENVQSGDAKNFLDGLQTVFLKHGAPHHYGTALTTANSMMARSSKDIRQFAQFALTDFNSVREVAADIQKFSDSNNRILDSLKDPPQTGFTFATHYALKSQEPSKLNYIALVHAQNVEDLKLAINNILLEQDIPDKKADGFLRAVNGSFRRLGISAHDQVELLSFVQDATKADSNLHNLAIQEANRITQITQGVVPSSAHTRGHDFH